jgi:hypothetical protein
MKRGVEGEFATQYELVVDDETNFLSTLGCHNILSVYY